MEFWNLICKLQRQNVERSEYHLCDHWLLITSVLMFWQDCIQKGPALLMKWCTTEIKIADWGGIGAATKVDSCGNRMPCNPLIPQVCHKPSPNHKHIHRLNTVSNSHGLKRSYGGEKVGCDTWGHMSERTNVPRTCWYHFYGCCCFVVVVVFCQK